VLSTDFISTLNSHKPLENFYFNRKHRDLGQASSELPRTAQNGSTQQPIPPPDFSSAFEQLKPP